MDSLCRVRSKIIYVLSWRTVSALTRALFWYLLINTKITLSWTLKRFVIRVHTLFSIYWQIYSERILILTVTYLFLVESLQQSNPSKMSCGCNGPLARYVKLRVAHAPGMPGTFSPSPRVYDPDMHHCTCVMHVPWVTPGSLTSGLLWSRWRGKRSRYSWRYYVSDKRPIPRMSCPWGWICRNIYVRK